MRGTTALVILTTLTVAGGCAGGSSPTATASTSPSAPPPSSASTLPASSASTLPASSASTPLTADARQATTVSSSATAWSTAPVTVQHVPAVPPLPVVTGIRYAAHQDGFDRLVLDIPGSLPGYSVKYVPEVRRDGSDEPVSLPGEAFLLIVLHPAQAHREDGTATVSGIHRTGLAGIKAYAVVGDYEG